MRKFFKKASIVLLAALLLFVNMPKANAEYTAPVSTVRIGLFTYTSDGSISERSFPSANLQNVSNYGYGYEFGYFDDSREFVSIGAYVTDTNKITVMKDKNMVFNSSKTSYSEGTEGSVVVGCFHIQLSDRYGTYDAAKAVIDEYGFENAFTKYVNGVFYICIGQYISGEDASAAAEAMGLAQSYAINSGSSYTLSVVTTGTNNIKFEFDCGGMKTLAIKPIAEEGVKAQTWCKGNRYYGAFCYNRISGGDIFVINYVDIEDYVRGVIPYEMSNSWPIEALKAQAVSARTYVMSNLNKHKNSGFDICNTIDCQAYRGLGSANATTEQAVSETEGMYLTYDGKLCQTYYYSSNGGASENSENVWTTSIPYLRGKIDPYEADVASSIINYTWKVTYTGDQLAERLRTKGYSCSTIKTLEILQLSDTGNVIKIRLTDTSGKTFTFSKESCRNILGLKSMRFSLGDGTSSAASTSTKVYINNATNYVEGALSSLFAVGSGGTSNVSSESEVYVISGTGTVEKISGVTSTSSSAMSITGSTFVISGSGYGHNVGMSQWGAYSMAKVHGKTYTEILEFYFTGTELV